MNLDGLLSGQVEGELAAADIPAALRHINCDGVTLQHVLQTDGETVRFHVSRGDYRKIRDIAAKRGYLVRISDRTGLYWPVKRLIRRPVLLLGLLFLLLFVLFLPTRIWFIQVEGNQTVPERQILEAAEACGIGFGAARGQVRSEQMKNALLQKIPQLQWAGVNTYGCVAVITVRERSTQQEQAEPMGISSIVAARDGIITACTATAGNLLCRPGQAVRAGETLISGYTDCGLTIRAERAAGEVYARTRRELTVLSPLNYEYRGEETARSWNFSLILGKKRINLYKDSGISGGVCDRIYAEYYVTLPGGFRLPIALAVEISVDYRQESGTADRSERQEAVAARAEDYIRRRMIAGSVEGADIQWSTAPDLIRMTGQFTCTEMIGRVHTEQIGEYHGENS